MPETANKEIIVSYPQHDILESRANLNLFLAGQGSGKSHCAGVLSGFFVGRFPKVRGIIAANTHDQLNKSTMFRIRQVWAEQYGWHEYHPVKRRGGVYVVNKQPPAHFRTEGHNYSSYFNIVSFANGAICYIYSLENYKMIEGSEVGWAILDETKDTREEAVKEVITGRTRQPGLYLDDAGSLVQHPTARGWNPIYMFTSPSKVQWLNEWFELEKHQAEILERIYSYPQYFRKQEANRLVVICPTHFNQENLSQGYIENRLASLSSRLADKLVFGNPFSQSGGEFYKGFDPQVNVAGNPFPYNPEIPVHISFDFNVLPYVTITIWQVYRRPGKITAIAIDEICAGPPHNSTEAACEIFDRKYPQTAGVFVYGDPSGNSKDTRSKGGRNDFSIIFATLKRHAPKKKWSNKAPDVIQRGNFLNSILEKETLGIQIVINPGCRHLINDLTYLKEDREGKKLKKVIKDAELGASYEEFGHTSDSMDYFICAYFFKEYNRFKHGKFQTPNQAHIVGAAEID